MSVVVVLVVETKLHLIKWSFVQSGHPHFELHLRSSCLLCFKTLSLCRGVFEQSLFLLVLKTDTGFPHQSLHGGNIFFFFLRIKKKLLMAILFISHLKKKPTLFNPYLFFVCLFIGRHRGDAVVVVVAVL